MTEALFVTIAAIWLAACFVLEFGPERGLVAALSAVGVISGAIALPAWAIIAQIG